MTGCSVADRAAGWGFRREFSGRDSPADKPDIGTVDDVDCDRSCLPVPVDDVDRATLVTYGRVSVRALNRMGRRASGASVVEENDQNVPLTAMSWRCCFLESQVVEDAKTNFANTPNSVLAVPPRAGTEGWSAIRRRRLLDVRPGNSVARHGESPIYEYCVARSRARCLAFPP